MAERLSEWMFTNCMGVEVEICVEKHIVNYKDKNIMWQNIKNKPIKWGFKMWYRYTLKTGHLYNLNIYTCWKETTEFG